MKRKIIAKRLISTVLVGTMLLGTVGDVYASDGGSCAEEATELELNTEYEVVIAEGGDVAWFSFTPEETGTYTFTSSNNICDNDEENDEDDDELDTYCELYIFDSEVLQIYAGLRQVCPKCGNCIKIQIR